MPANKELQLTPRTDPMHGTLTPIDMLRLAVEKGADLAQLEKLMDMKERWEANEARKAFVAALNAFKASPPKLTKDREIRHNGRLVSKYAGLDQVSAVIGAALTAHGFAHRWEVEQTPEIIKVSCVLTHELGHSERVFMQAPADQSGAKNPVQAIGSTITYLERYTLLAVTGLATTDQDDDDDGGGGGGVISAEQKETLIALIKETNSDTTKYCAHLKIAALDDLPASRFNEAVRVLEAKKGRAK